MKKAFVAAFPLLVLLARLAAAQAPSASEGDAKDDPGKADAPDALTLSGSVGAHDPTIAVCAGKYYRFSTGLGIPMAVSSDLKSWAPAGSGTVFDRIPAWTRSAVPGSTDFWAPEVVKLGGRYRIYYAISTFGSNVSAIGVASNATLDPLSPDYAWIDEGAVIESRRADDFNAIDPAVAFAPNGAPYLAFGSFWSGIKLVELDRDTGKLAKPGESPLPIARRPSPPDAIEGAYILPKDGKYYLFVSFDFCCRGSSSTYNIRVGRSNSIEGPYLDRDGKPMLEGGGTLVRESGARYKGPGHNSVLVDAGVYYLVYHAYDAQAGGLVRCRIEPLRWDAEGWPFVNQRR
jgi:arabinan endo-1,5-alpha-L-arabinosidase